MRLFGLFRVVGEPKEERNLSRVSTWLCCVVFVDCGVELGSKENQNVASQCLVESISNQKGCHEMV